MVLGEGRQRKGLFCDAGFCPGLRRVRTGIASPLASIASSASPLLFSLILSHFFVPESLPLPATAPVGVAVLCSC